jgi:DNA repair protein RadD
VPSVRELIDLGFLVESRVYAPSQPDLDGVKVDRGDYNETQLAERMDTQRLVGDIIEHYLRLGRPRRAVVFATGVQHSKHLCDEFRRAGVLAEHIDGTTPTDERDQILARLAAGSVDVVCNAMVLTEGWDCPEVSCLILARPTRSIGLFRQMIGRGLRTAPGKSDCLIFDHAGATFQHGFADDPIEWTLRDDQRAENKAHAARGARHTQALTTCPECSAVRYEGKPCPACGWRPQPEAKPVEVLDGDLGEVGRDRSVMANVNTADDRLRFARADVFATGGRCKPPGQADGKCHLRPEFSPPLPPAFGRDEREPRRQDKLYIDLVSLVKYSFD